MKPFQTSNDERAVSPVIGVILMVAITVILAAVIGSFTLGIGSNVQEAPQASLEVDHDAGEITHQGGDDLVSGDIDVTDDDGATELQTTLTPGNTVSIKSSFSGTVRVVHTPTGSVIFTAEP